MDLAGKKVVIMGFGVEGMATADFLLAKGASVEIRDIEEASAFEKDVIAGYETKGVLFRFGPGGYIDSADLVVRSPGVPPGIPPLVAAKARGIPVSSGTQLFLELCPAPVIGVTGTKGKGTTASLIHEMFRAAGRTSGNGALPELRT